MNTHQSNQEKKHPVDIENLSDISFGKQILLGAMVADSVAMPVHWYYNQSAIERDFGILDCYHSPKKIHPDSILWRSEYKPLNADGDILREQAQYWGNAAFITTNS